MLAKLAIGTLRRVSLELGGKHHLSSSMSQILALPSKAPYSVNFGARAGSCKWLYVQKGVATAFTIKLVEKVNTLRIGYGLEPSATQGLLVNKSAVAKVREHLSDAVSKGAKVEVKQDMVINKYETFGPLAPIFEFYSEDDAIRLANDTEFELASYFFSRNVSRVMRVAQKMQVGMIGVNVKESGYGREGILYGLEEYQNITSIAIGNQKAGASQGRQVTREE